jgi:hypothetical protein
LADLALVLPFVLLLAVDCWHHDMWGDELHAWGLTVGSGSLGELFHNLHYEGHPGLWHLMLWIPSRLSPSPIGIRLVSFAVGAAIILMIGLVSPFSRAEKILLLLNYFIVFEYTVMARNYGIGLLLAMLYAVVRRGATERPVLAGLLLGAMANANVYALFLSGFLALEYGWHRAFGAGRPSWMGVVGLVPGGVLYCALLLLAALTLRPPPDITHQFRAGGGTELGGVAWFGLAALHTLVAPFVPIDFSFPASFAFPGNWFEHGRRVLAAACLLPLILAAQWTVLRHARPLLLALAGTALAVTIFQVLFYPAAIRHLGVMFIGFIVALWLLRERLPAQSSPVSWPVLALLALGALGGGTALAGQWMRPFAVDDQAVQWLRANGFADTPIIGGTDMYIEPIGVLMHRPFYSLDCMCEDRFVRYLNRRDGFDAAMLPDRLARLAERLGPGSFLLLMGIRLDQAQRDEIAAKGFGLTELVYLSGAERDKEMAIYRVDPPAR